MDFLSVFSGVDSLRKFLVILGLTLIVGGFLYPFQKRIDFENKKTQFIQEQKIDSLNVTYLKKEAEKIKNLVSLHKQECELLRVEQKSLNSYSQEFKEIESSIEKIKQADLILIEKVRLETHKTEEIGIKLNSVKESLKNTDKNICYYFWVQLVVIIGGIVLLFFGFRRWNKSEVQSMTMFETEVKIKEEELKKIIRDNKV